MGRSHRTLAAAWLFLVFAPCFAEEIETIEFEFKVFGVGLDHYEDLYFFTEERFEPLEFHPTHRSVRTYSYKGEPSFGIYVLNPLYDASDPNSKEFLKIAAATAPLDAKRQLIVFAAHPKNRESSNAERRFKLFHINDEPDKFPRNTIIIVNTTNAKLYGRVADKKLSLPVGFSTPIPYESSNSKRAATKIAFALESENGAKLVMSNDLRLPDNRRVLLILEPPRRLGSLRIEVRILSESIFQSAQEALPD